MDVKNYKLRLNLVWHWTMLYSSTHMSTVGVNGLKFEVRKCLVFQSLYGEKAENIIDFEFILECSETA